MTHIQHVYFPPRVLLNDKLMGNAILKLDHTGRIEEAEVEGYHRRGITGWSIIRSNGERILVVTRKTIVDPHGYLLLAPDVTSLPDSQNSAGHEYRWITPKPYFINKDVDLSVLRASVRHSWKDNFHFLEESKEVGVVTPGLRSPQIGALYASLAHWKVTTDLGTVVMPTGTGKTETMLALLVRERPECLLVIVPTSALRDQIADKFLTFGVLQQFGVIGNGAELPVVGKIEHRFDTANDVHLFMQSCNVVVATMAVVGSCCYEVQQAFAENCSHLFIDEAHHAPARTWNTFRELVSEVHRPILQFTATPFRRDGKHVGGKTIFSYPLRKAQEEGYFTPITFVSIWEYDRTFADTAIAMRAIQALQTDLSDGYDHLLMARTDNIQRARDVHAIYANLAPHLNPLIIHSQQRVGARLSAIEALRTRSSRLIVCVDMLGEGFDLPQLKIAALHDVHKSLAVTIQFIGRFTRFHSVGIGEATIVANAADAEVEEALEDLYAKDSDWNIILRQLSEGATSRQQKRSEFLEGFQGSPEIIPLQNIYPKMSTVVYKTTCQDWDPRAVIESLKNVDLLVEPTIHPTEHVLLFITRQQTPVTWGETQSVNDLIHCLYLMHWDERQKLLFINSTDNKSLHSSLAETLVGDDTELIRGEKVYRCLYNVNRLILSNLGLIHLLSRATQFTMHVGTDLKEGLSRASLSNRRKSNLFSRGYEDGEKVTVGASHKGRIWSHHIADDISEWVDWCQHIGAKLLDEAISTDKILEHAIIPEEIQERPPLVPITIEWPPYFLLRNEEAIYVEINAMSVPFYEADLSITTFSDSGPIRFRIAIEDEEAEYEIVFKRNLVEYQPIGKSVAYIRASGQQASVTSWFQEEYPLVTFEDTSQLEYNEIFRPKTEREPYDISKIEAWSWLSTQLNQESQYKHQKKSKTLKYQIQSIQKFVIDRLKSGYVADYDVIFDDDGKGEIADIVALKVAGDNLLVHLFHCKYAKSKKIGVRVGDFYEVCGQAQKGVYWRSEVKKLFDRLKLRETNRKKTYGISRFEEGDLQKLDDLKRRSRFLRPEFHVYIVQPGLSAEKVDTSILDLLGATELYLRETFDVPLTVIASP